MVKKYKQEPRKRHFNKPRAGLERDAQGHRTGYKLLVRIKRPMSVEGFKRFSNFSKKHIAKHKFVYVPFSSTAQMKLKNGIPINIMKNPDTMARYLIDLFYLQDGEEYEFQGWTGTKRTPTGTKFTPRLFILQVHSANNYKYTFVQDWRLRRMWFRKETKKEE